MKSSACKSRTPEALVYYLARRHVKQPDTDFLRNKKIFSKQDLYLLNIFAKFWLIIHNK